MSCQLSAFSHQLLAFSLMASVLLLSLTVAASAQEQKQQEAPEKVYVVSDYRYVPANDTDDRDIGLSLCGTRCNALTTDYLNITDVGGWLLMKGAVNREVAVKLNNPFIKGQCICIADEYLVKRDDRYSEERRRQGKQK